MESLKQISVLFHHFSNKEMDVSGRPRDHIIVFREIENRIDVYISYPANEEEEMGQVSIMAAGILSQLGKMQFQEMAYLLGAKLLERVQDIFEGKEK